jgi:hypothetical protein
MQGRFFFLLSLICFISKRTRLSAETRRSKIWLAGWVKAGMLLCWTTTTAAAAAAAAAIVLLLYAWI